MPDPRHAFHGARAEFKVGAKLVAWATDVQVRVMYQNVPVEVLGDPIIQRQVTVGVQVEISCGFVRIVGDEGDLVGSGILPQMDSTAIVNWDESVCTIVDKLNDKVKYVVQGAKPAALSLQMNARSLALHNVTFVGRTFYWESENKA